MITIINIILTVAAVTFLFVLRHQWLERKYPPGPYGLPIIGYLPFLDSRQPHKSLQSLAQRYGPVFSLRLGSVLTVVLTDAKIVREFLKREEFTARAPLYVTHGIMGGYGLICAEGQRWTDQRRQVIDWLKCLGMVKKSSLSRTSFAERIRKGAVECVQLMCEDANTSGQIDPSAILHHTIGNVVNSLVFGITYKRDDVIWRYLQSLQDEGVKLIGVSGVVNFLPFLRILPGNRRAIQFLLQGKQKTHSIYDSIIHECQQRLAHEISHCNAPQEQFSCILEYFLYERSQRESSTDAKLRKTSVEYYSDEQLRHLLADMYGAGVDTTLTTLRWLLLFMARNVRCQKKLQTYLAQLPPFDQLRLNHFENFDYLRACIAETQRIRIVVPLGIPHGTVRDTQVLGYTIPKGCMILPLMWAIHMNECVWPEAEQFQPERFLNEAGKYQQRKEFMPFQSGKRMCLGDEMANMMLLTYAALLFSRFTFKLGNGFEGIDMSGECGITLFPPYYELIIERNSDEF